MNLNDEIIKFKELNEKMNGVASVLKGGAQSGLLTKALKMLMSGKIDLEALGLPADMVDELEEYQRTAENLCKVCEAVNTKMEAKENA